LKFKEYIEESRNSPIYHGSRLSHVKDILLSNKLIGKSIQIPKWLNGNKLYGISLSRNFNTSGQVIFEIDQKNLSNNYKILPIKQWAIQNNKQTRFPDNNEYEEFLITKELTNLIKYVNAIWIPENVDINNIISISDRRRKQWERLVKRYKDHK